MITKLTACGFMLFLILGVLAAAVGDEQLAYVAGIVYVVCGITSICSECYRGEKQKTDDYFH